MWPIVAEDHVGRDSITTTTIIAKRGSRNKNGTKISVIRRVLLLAIINEINELGLG